MILVDASNVALSIAYVILSTIPIGGSVGVPLEYLGSLPSFNLGNKLGV